MQHSSSGIYLPRHIHSKENKKKKEERGRTQNPENRKSNRSIDQIILKVIGFKINMKAFS